ncbi:MAG: WecB/TagA/CpsF family glycosyltransferase [Candidatus Sericytochromatia bacterium]
MKPKSILYLAMPYDQGQSGISEYIRATLKELSKQTSVQLVALNADLPELTTCLAPGSHRVKGIANYWGHPILSLLWFLVILPWQLRKAVPEAVFVPAGNRRLLLQKTFPQISTVHDLAPLRLPKKYDPLRQFYLTRLLPMMLKRAGKLVAISQQTADDLVELADIAPEQIRLAPNGYDASRFVQPPAPDDFERLARLGLMMSTDKPKPYLLYVARIENPGKNHIGLLKAWMALPSFLRKKHTLVLAGSDWKGAEGVHQWVAEHKPENVVFTGFVQDADLPTLYRHAQLYLQPSLYEGFGLPLVEAMASGCPVLSSNRGALAEVGGDAVCLVDPLEEGALAQALLTLMVSPQARHALVKKGLQRALDFSWERHAQAILAELLPSPSLRLQGLELRNAHLDQVMAEISERVHARIPTRLYYVNADCLNLAWSDLAYRQALEAADLLLPDGSGVALGARMTGQSLIENLNGTDMFVPLCEQAISNNWRVWFLGGRPEVNLSLVQNLQLRWPDLQIAGHHHGYYDASQEAEIVKTIREAQPHILLVAMGAPQQERWIAQYAGSLQVPLMMGVGGLFDFYSGRIPRAPQLLRKLGLEWTWRLLQEPLRLWRRYLLGNPLFVLRMLRTGKRAPQVL